MFRFLIQLADERFTVTQECLSHTMHLFTEIAFYPIILETKSERTRS
jgi:hypothetical protein